MHILLLLSWLSDEPGGWSVMILKASVKLRKERKCKNRRERKCAREREREEIIVYRWRVVDIYIILEKMQKK
jgi:hypothetical protein